MLELSNKIGVITDSFRLGLKEGLVKAREVGAHGVQIYAVQGEMAPENLTASKRQEWKSFIADQGLEISALVGDLGGHGFQDEAANPRKIEQSKRILDLAMDLGTRIVTTHIGVVPSDPTSRMYHTMQQACAELANYATSLGAYFAIETGPETAAHLKAFLDTLQSKGLSVNFDPANMVMVTGDDPAKGVHILRDYIVHTHAKDGVRLREVDPNLIYGSLGVAGGLDHEELSRQMERGDLPFKEVPLGEGSVVWESYLQALKDIGYTGYLTIEREVGADPERDIRQAVAFLQHYRA